MNEDEIRKEAEARTKFCVGCLSGDHSRNRHIENEVRNLRKIHAK